MKVLVTLIALCLALASSASYAADEDTAKADAAKADAAKADAAKADAAKAKPAKAAAMPMFKPTNLGAPMTRLGGATRSATGSVPRAEALVPEIAGHTLQAQPVLYWYLAGKTDERIDFALIGVDPINPIREITLEGPFEPGIQRIRLADHAITLQPNLEYQWFVRVIPNPDQRLYDRVIGGGIQRLEASAELDAKLAAAKQGESHYVLAEAGIWYDALDSLSVQIDAAPKNENLRAQRAALFDQVGLENVE
jgi:hypothetical protein